MRALDVALKATTGRWWATHKDHIKNWSQLKTLIIAQFSSIVAFEGIEYARDTSPKDHVDMSIEVW